MLQRGVQRLRRTRAQYRAGKPRTAEWRAWRRAVRLLIRSIDRPGRAHSQRGLAIAYAAPIYARTHARLARCARAARMQCRPRPNAHPDSRLVADGRARPPYPLSLCARWRARLLSAWLCHLVMCARAGAKEAPRTIWLGHPDEFAFKPVQRGRARAHLAELAALYGFGQCAPLRFFPISAWALVHQGEAAARR